MSKDPNNPNEAQSEAEKEKKKLSAFQVIEITQCERISQ